MLLAVSKRLGQYPLCTLTSARQAMHGASIFSPDQALVVGVPDELEMFLVQQVVGKGELDLEPVRRPTGAKGFADFCRMERV